MVDEELCMIELLSEIKNACENKNVDYFVVGKELLFHQRRTRVFSCSSDICMLYEHFLSIYDELCGNEDRFIEDIGNNPDFPGLYFRYVNTKTLMIEPEYVAVRKHNGIAVNIHVLRGTGKRSYALCAVEQNMSKAIGGCNTNSVSALSLFSYKVLKHKNDYSDYMLKSLRICAVKNYSEASLLNIPQTGIMRFPENFWTDKKQMNIEDFTFTTVSSPDKVLSQWYGESYKKIPIRPSTENYVQIVDATISYKEMEEGFWKQFNRSNEFWNKRRKYLDFYKNEWISLNNKLSHEQNYLYLQSSRLLLWKKYHYQKKKIKELFVLGRYDELSLVFSELDEHVERHLKYSMIPLFDNDIWNYYIKTLVAQGYSKKVAFLKIIQKKSKIRQLNHDEIERYYAEHAPDEMLTMRSLL